MLQQSTVDALSDPKHVVSGKEAREALREFFRALSEAEAQSLLFSFWKQLQETSRTQRKGTSKDEIELFDS